jgi:chromosome segregation ATPase
MQKDGQTSIEPLITNQPSPEVREAVRSLWYAINKIAPFLKSIALENRNLREGKADLESAVLNSDEQIGSLTKNLELLEKKYDDSFVEISKLNDEVERLTNALRNQMTDNVEKDQLLEQIRELEEVKKNFSLAQKEFINKNQALYERAEIINEQKAKIAEQENYIRELEASQAAFEKLEAQNREQHLRITDFTNEIDTIRNQSVESLRIQLEENIELKNTIVALQHDLKAMESSIADLNKYTDELKSEIKEKELSIKSSTEYLQKIENELQAKNNEIEQLVNEITDLQKFKEADSQKEKIIGDYSAELNKLTAEKTSLEVGLEEEITKNDILSKSIAEFQSKAEKADSLSVELNSVKDELQNYQDIISKKENMIEEINNKLKTIEDDKQSLEACLEDEIKKNDDLKSSVGEGDVLQREFDNLQITIASLNNEKAENAIELGELRTVNRELQNKVDELLSKISNLESIPKSQNLELFGEDNNSEENNKKKKLLIDKIENYLVELEKYLN